ncbi:hypothetical protein TeGR_g14241, partial [Tetraparma gracilis]
FEKAESEKIVRRKERKEKRRFEKKERQKLLSALVKRRDLVLNAMRKAEVKPATEGLGRRKKLEVELSFLDKDIERLEGTGVIIIQ